MTARAEINCLGRDRADINRDWYVDFTDFSLFADKRLAAGNELSPDIMPINGDNIVNVYDFMLIADEWLGCFVSGVYDPSPADGQENIVLNPVLIWSPQEDSIHSDVYFGTNPGSVVTATHDSEEFLGTVIDNRFTLERTSEPDTVYYRRVDRIGPKCFKFGDIWSFRTTGN